ncbi:MAG: phosphopyruvate hydratase [Clostridia bacterium]|nr:phosphopyruvate hydratase [Clostridia bacterium]
MHENVKTEIVKISAVEILDSRANPTVSCEVKLASGARGRAEVPSGASTGKYEAHEKRDGGARFGGRGVQNVCEKIETELSRALCGKDAANQKLIDGLLIRADGAPDKSNFGANALLAVSLASARASACAYGLPLYRYLGGVYGSRLPVPMMNVINGGAHAANNLEIQEFMLVPTGAKSYADGVRACAEIYAHIGALLRKKGLSTAVGDEGGFAPSLESDEEAVTLLCEAIEAAGYGTDKVKIALDVAASSWACEAGYRLPKSGELLSAGKLTEKLRMLAEKYPIISIEDPVGEDDEEAWQSVTATLGKKLMLVGDDLFVTDAHRIAELSEKGCANSALIKPNQCGTLSETVAAVQFAKKAGYKTIISHRSGDTADTFIADLAVAVNADFIKAGAPARGERVAKYNRLLEIEKEICFM